MPTRFPIENILGREQCEKCNEKFKEAIAVVEFKIYLANFNITGLYKFFIEEADQKLRDFFILDLHAIIDFSRIFDEYKMIDFTVEKLNTIPPLLEDVYAVLFTKIIKHTVCLL